MEITKLEHSGIIIKNGEDRIIFDPVEFEEKIPKLNNVVAIIITHKHGDHLQIETLNKILSDNPNAKIFTTSDSAPLIKNATIVKAGDIHKIGEFKLDFFGQNHASIIPGQIPCENIGVLVNDTIVNPGDSFNCPYTNVKVLLTPISAPWLKTAESMDFIATVKPQIVIPMHNALLSELGKSINGNLLKNTCDKVGAEYKDLKPNDSLVC